MNSVSNLNKLRSDGVAVYQNNPILRDVADFMSTPTTRRFYDEYFRNIHSLDSFLMYANIWRDMDKLDGTVYDMDGYQKLGMLWNILMYPVSRSAACKRHSELTFEEIKKKIE